MSRKPAPPAHQDPNRRYASQEANRTADLLPYVQRIIESLHAAERMITRGRMTDETKYMILLSAWKIAGEQFDVGRRVTAEYSMRRGLSQSLAAKALGVSHTLAGTWYHNPVAHEEAFTE